jgi:hypothetical protein
MTEFFNYIIDFISTGIYDIVVNIVTWLISGLTYMYFKSQLLALEFSWDVGQKLLEDLNISQYMQDAFSHFDSQSQQILLYFRVPESLNVLMGAYSTRYVMRFLGL